MKAQPFQTPDSVLDPGSFLKVWRQERAYRVAKSICWVGMPLALAAAVVDKLYSTWEVWGGDLLIFFSCILSLYLSRHKKGLKKSSFVWWPAYGSYWISSFGTFYATGGINSPFLSLVLIVLYVCGVIVQTQVHQIYIFLFAGANVIFWMAIELVYPLSYKAEGLSPVFTGSIICLGMAVLGACIAEVLRTEKKLSQELLGQYEKLLEARQRLEREELANATKTSFLANVSHELRTPLGAILGYVELIKDPDSTSAEKTLFLDTIQRNGQQLSRLVDDLLDLSKVEAGKIEIEKVEFSPLQIFQEIIALFRLSAQRKNLALDLEFKGKIPELVISDPLRIKQVLMNVIGNAIKFTDTGFIRISVEFDLQMQSGSGVFKVVIEDSGRGLTPEEQKKLFKPFSQADASMARRYGGTGLGLNLSRKLAHLLAGELELSASHKNQGSTFIFSFRVKVPAQVQLVLVEKEFEVGVNTSASKIKEDPMLRGLQILVVDDMPDNQNLVKAYLRSTGAKVETANNGLEGVEKATQGQFEVILMDIQMPILDGINATQRIRGQNFKGIIIALSAHAMNEDKVSALKAGCDAYLTKPIDKLLLIDKIKTSVKRRSQSNHTMQDRA